MPNNEEYITAIEIGTHAIKVCMGAVNDDTVLRLVGYHEVQTNDLVRKGEIHGANAILDLLTQALEELERSTRRSIETVFLAVTGSHFKSRNVQGNVPVSAPDRVISELDVIAATKNAREWKFPPDQLWVASFQRAFVIDNRHRVPSPVGMVADRLTADNHMIYGDRNRIETQLRLVQNVLGDPVTDVVFSGIAGYYGAQRSQETDQGCMYIDIGQGITEYVMFHEGGCMLSGQIAVGLDHIANDLALGLRLPLDLCRELAEKHGSAILWSDHAGRKIPAPDHLDKDRCIPEGCIHRIMELRLQEIFEIIRDHLDEESLRQLLSDGVILGGGGAMIPNICDLAQQVFKVPVSIGLPKQLEGLPEEAASPRMLTPIGVLFVGQKLNQIQTRSQPLHRVFTQEVSSLARTVWDSFKM